MKRGNKKNNNIVEHSKLNSHIPKCEQEILLKMLEFGENIILNEVEK